jgi:hypothetical protein
MLATEDILNQYRNQLDKGYDGEYLNRSEHLLNSGYQYDSVSIQIKPLAKKELGDIEFNGNITFKTEAKSQYGASVVKKQVLNLNLLPAKQSGCNFGSDRVEKKLLPYYDGKFESSGHFHPFYKSVSDLLEETLIDNTDMKDKVWWSLLFDYRNDFRPVDFGLLVMYIEDGKFNAFVKYNAFEWDTQLNWNEDLECLEKSTRSKKICLNQS